MDDVRGEWLFRIVVSIIPVGVLVASIPFGYPEFDALSEGSSILLYFIVILSSEIVAIYFFQTEGLGIWDRARNVILLVMVTLIWLFLIWARVIAANNPAGTLPFQFIAVAAVSVLPSYFVVKYHWEFFKRRQPVDSRKYERKQMESLKGKPPDKDTIGGKPVEF